MLESEVELKHWQRHLQSDKRRLCGSISRKHGYGTVRLLGLSVWMQAVLIFDLIDVNNPNPNHIQGKCVHYYHWNFVMALNFERKLLRNLKCYKQHLLFENISQKHRFGIALLLGVLRIVFIIYMRAKWI